MNFLEILDIQKQEDRQAFIIHYPANTGKSLFVQKACALRPGLFRLDLLIDFLGDPGLQVKQFNPERLQKYLLSYAYPGGTYTVFVDNPDFLFNTWGKAEKEAFIQWLSYPLRTPAATDKTFIIVIQTDDVVRAARLNNSRHQSRILALNEFDAL